MNFLGLGKSRIETEREKKIKEFRQAFPNLRKPYHDDSIYEVVFQSDQVYMTLRIFLTADFPTSKPG